MADFTTILPTSRAIRARIAVHQEHDGFLPRYITIGEFLQRAVNVEGCCRIDEDTRTLLLLEAADFKAFNALQIERNFFTFTQNATYLFRFFEELSGELVEMSTLELADTYGDYEEHILILQELYRRYKQFCDERNVLDPIYLPETYQLNVPYLQSLGKIRLVAEGYLTNFELKLLAEIAKIIPVVLEFESNRFNQKMQAKFSGMGMAIENDTMVLIDFQNLELLDSRPLKSDVQISSESFSERLLQIGFIKQKVYEFVEKGIAPERIAVVLPDEGFAEHLRHFDSENNFNFAMGFSLASAQCVRKIEAVTDYLDNSSVENASRLNRIGTELHGVIAPIYKAEVGVESFRSVVQAVIEQEGESAVRKIVEEELYLFEKLLPAMKGSSLKSALYLFVNRLKSRSVDDVRGGKVTVMGVLETRSITFDGVIVVDFNEGIVPRKSEKDLFLNSATRIKAGLPGSEERQALQKLYYHNLFRRAKAVAIAYVEAADSVPTRFLTQLGIETSKTYDDTLWATIMLKHNARKKYAAREIVADYDFTKRPLSATGLKTFLSCKRRFYHRYVEGLSPHEIGKDMPDEHEIGTALHNALRDVYRQQPRFSDKLLLKEAIAAALQAHNGTTLLDDFLHKLWTRRLEPFVDNEIERFKHLEVVSCEESMTCSIGGLTLTGQLDRIDRGADGLEVLDYKSGSFPIYTAKSLEKAVDFQLEFYYLLASQKGSVAQCGYYDLKRGMVVNEALLQEKLALLSEHLSGLEATKRFNFEQTEDMSACRYCDYAHLCQREL